MEDARGRRLALTAAWCVALILAYAGAATHGLFSIMLVPAFPAGLILLLPLKHLSDGVLTVLILLVWAFYVAISRAILVAKKEKTVVTLAVVLGTCLLLNVAGCDRIATGVSRIGH